MEVRGGGDHKHERVSVPGQGRLGGEIDGWMDGSGEERKENASVAPLDS